MSGGPALASAARRLGLAWVGVLALALGRERDAFWRGVVAHYGRW
jgi:hypothetical protein